MTDIFKQRSCPSRQRKEGMPRDTPGTHRISAGSGFAHLVVDSQRLLDMSWGSLKGQCKTADTLEPPDWGGSALKQRKAEGERGPLATGRFDFVGTWQGLGRDAPAQKKMNIQTQTVL